MLSGDNESPLKNPLTDAFAFRVDAFAHDGRRPRGDEIVVELRLAAASAGVSCSMIANGYLHFQWTYSDSERLITVN